MSLTEALIHKQIEVPKSLHHLKQIGFESYASTTLSQEIESLFAHLKNNPHLHQKETSFQTRSLRVGVVFSGGQAPGGHNVLWGLLDALKTLHPNSSLIGFLNGPAGFLKQDFIKIEKETLKPFQNLGGFHLIGSGRTKIETSEQLSKALESARALKLDAFVIIGGDDSNTNAAVLAEFFLSKNQKTAVIGVPKTIDGDLKNSMVEVSFGFDTAAAVYSELIGNLLYDALSSRKYTHFVKLMGRSASHLTLECALRTRPNYALIGEEIAKKNQSLKEIVQELSQLIYQRHLNKKDYGLILIPEGLIDFIPEFKCLNEEISHLLNTHQNLSINDCCSQLSPSCKETFTLLPHEIQEQLLLERDPHGNIPLAKIETGKLLVSLIDAELKNLGCSSFKPLNHYFGYEGRSSHPSVFDAHYTYSLGLCAALLCAHEKTGYMACVQNLMQSIDSWTLAGLPITSLLHIEMRKGQKKPVIKKALVNLQGESFKLFSQNRQLWASEDHYLCPGPMQLLQPIEKQSERSFLLGTRCT